MKIRGERECTNCETRWSYYETGSIGCPACGSLRSVGTDERAEHTDLPAEFDLTPIRAAVDDVSTGELASQARDRCRAYVRRRGFLSGGELRSLDDEYLAAIELLYVADEIRRARTLDHREELYFLSLLAHADGGVRPDVDEVAPSLRAARGFAYATAARDYSRDVRRWSETSSLEADSRSTLETLGDHVTRIRMLDGDVEPDTAEALVEATRALGDALRGDDELAHAREHLERIADTD